MDDIYLPDESDLLDEEEEVEFERRNIEEHPAMKMQGTSGGAHPSGLNPSDYVKITFGRFVTLVANHSFVEVVEENKQEEVIISTNLLTDLANARRVSPATKGPLLTLAGLVVGFLLAYFLFQ